MGDAGNGDIRCHRGQGKFPMRRRRVYPGDSGGDGGAIRHVEDDRRDDAAGPARGVAVRWAGKGSEDAPVTAVVPN